MVKQYRELYLDARRQLLPVEDEQAAFYARELLAAASGKSIEAVVADRDLYASEEIVARMERYVARAVAGEPLAYILGKWQFHGMELHITPDVLIPRDDTEVVTEVAIDCARQMVGTPRVLDLCTGSGCIGLAIARSVPSSRVTLGDVSQAALRVARRNVSELGLGSRVYCVRIDALSPAAPFLGKFDLIVSNPPYVTKAEMVQLELSVRDYEPHLALDGGVDGLQFYRAIVENFTSALRPNGLLCFEIGMGQHEAVEQILREKEYEILCWKEDTGNRLRAVAARAKGEQEEYGE